MGSAWSEFKNMSNRRLEMEKDDFFPMLDQLTKGLYSFQKLDTYCTTDFRVSYAKIELRGPTSNEDAKLIHQFLRDNPRDNWNVSVEIY